MVQALCYELALALIRTVDSDVALGGLLVAPPLSSPSEPWSVPPRPRCRPPIPPQLWGGERRVAG